MVYHKTIKERKEYCRTCKATSCSGNGGGCSNIGLIPIEERGAYKNRKQIK